MLVVITALAAFAAIRTLRTLKVQVDANVVAATAAKNSADIAAHALAIANRPRLMIRHVTMTDIDRGETGSSLLGGYVWVVNQGTASARLFKVYTEWLLVERLPLENPALYAIDNEDRNIEIMPSAIFKIELSDRQIEGLEDYRFSPDATRAQAPPSKKLYLIGYLKYQDRIGLRRRYFCFRYDEKRGRFCEVRHPNYNYED